MADGLTEELAGSTASNDQKNKAEQTVERLKASSKWLRDNFWDEWKEAFRSYEVRTDKIVFPNGHPRVGQEDKTRTNIALPEFFIATRRKAERKSRRPPQITVRSSKPDIGFMLSHMAMYQWDRANEQRNQYRHVLQGDIFGISLKVHDFDDVAQSRALRFKIEDVLDQLYVKINETDAMRNFIIVPDNEGDLGPDGLVQQQDVRKQKPIKASKLSDEDQANFIAQHGPEMMMPKSFTRFSGPVSSWQFIGDWYPEPELEDVQTAAWNIFENIHGAEWLAYHSAQEYIDPETGQKKSVLDRARILELEEYRPMENMNYRSGTDADDEFRQSLRDAIFKSRPDYESRLAPGRRYKIIKDYHFRKGVCWVRFVGNGRIFLGERPIPWDLGGRYPVSKYVPMPALLHGIGDSTPRKGRYLWKLHNITFSQRTDLVTAALKKIVALPKAAATDLPDEMLDLGYMRVIFSDYARDILQALQAGGVTIPREAWESESALIRALQQLEPSMIDFGEQSQAVPNSQKVATLGLLQQRASDAISSGELEKLNDSIAEETDIKLAMWQQVLTEGDLRKMTDDNAFWSITGGGGTENPRKQWNDPLELQEDFEVFPEMGSTLALDDIMRKQQAQEVYDRAIGAPQIWNVQEAARRLAMASGVTNPQALLAPPAPPPPPEKPKLTVSAKIELTPQQQDAVLAEYGVPTPPEDTDARNMMQHVKNASEAADAAQKLMGDHPDQQPEPLQ